MTARAIGTETAAAGLVADVLRLAMLMDAGDYAGAGLVADTLPDLRAAVMAAAAMIRTDAAVPLSAYVERALPAAERFLKGHGTIGGYERHRRRGEAPCGACRACRVSYDRAQYRSRNRGRQEAAS